LSFALSPDETSRIAAQVVTGVGLLGAGAILHDRGGVRGVTTAATVWTMAAIGMVIGAGYALVGLALSVFTLVLLLAVVEIETRFLGPCSIAEAALLFDAAGGKTHVRVEEILDRYHIEQGARSHVTQEDGSIRLRFRYCDAHKHHREFLTQLASLDEVREIAREIQAR
jgi:putative Mg2+ transporter-C (MgtC) family protein